MLLSPPLMRPQLWPSHSAPLAPHPPGLAAVPSPPPTPPHAPAVSHAPPTTPQSTWPVTPHCSSGSRWHQLGRLGWQCQAGGVQRQPKALWSLPFPDGCPWLSSTPWHWSVASFEGEAKARDQKET